MDEKYTRTKKSPKEEGESKERTFGKKLKNDESRKDAMGKKLRVGKADTKIQDIQGAKKHARKLRYVSDSAPGSGKSMVMSVSGVIHGEMANQNADDNAGVEALNTGTGLVEGAIYSSKKKTKSGSKSGYGNKLHGKRTDEKVPEITPQEMQKNYMKKETQMKAFREQSKNAANSAGSLTKRFVDKAEDLVGKMAEAVIEWVQSHPLITLLAGGFILLVVMISAMVSSVTMIASGTGPGSMSGTYTAEDSDIKKVEDNYRKLESDLRKTIGDIETDYPDYDEYVYHTTEISHNPHELTALLTVLYEDYKPSQVQTKIQEIMNDQYSLTTKETVETRKRKVTKWHWVTKKRTVIVDGKETEEEYDVWESYEDWEEYDYYILTVTLTGKSIDTIARSMGLTEEQLARYEVLLELQGCKPELFAGDIYANPNPGEYQDYKVPAEYLTDLQFGRMLKEAEKYLGYPYVWGGSSPDTSFDCSGYVSYVINNCGNGWNVGRQTANGLLAHCAAIDGSEAKPGDLIFFQGTYETSGASHVGIYVGDGMMIHCGNPIQYASINTPYWQSHFYTFGRIDH